MRGRSPPSLYVADRPRIVCAYDARTVASVFRHVQRPHGGDHAGGIRAQVRSEAVETRFHRGGCRRRRSSGCPETRSRASINGASRTEKTPARQHLGNNTLAVFGACTHAIKGSGWGRWPWTTGCWAGPSSSETMERVVSDEGDGMAAGNGAPFLAVTGGEGRVAPVHGGACRPFGRIRVLPKEPPAARPPPPATRRTLAHAVVVVCYPTGPMRFAGTPRGSPHPSLSMSARTASAIADPAGAWATDA